MRCDVRCLAVAVLLAGVVGGRGLAAGNAVPTAESFESYAAGFAIANAAGWSVGVGADEHTGRVSTNAMALEALGAYTNAGKAFPLNTTHEQVLELRGPVTQSVTGPAGALVRTDMLLMPFRSEDPPALDPTVHAALCFSSNGQAIVCLRNTSAGTNEWRTLEFSPVFPSQNWVRVTFLQDYANRMFQVSLDGQALADSQGWSGPPPTGVATGSWFHMPATTGAMTLVAFAGDGEAYLDDLEIVRDLPAIATLMASNVTAATADLPGYLSFTGLAQTAVSVYWGTTDGGTNAEAWATNQTWAAPQAPGLFSHTTAVTQDTVVYYRYAAQNAYGTQWATGTAYVVVGAVAMDLLRTDSDAKERPVDTGAIRIERPEWSTNLAVTVRYGVGGNAWNGADYEVLPGSVVIPAGEVSADVTVTPIPDGVTESNETVLLSLLPGAYQVGGSSLGQVTIKDAAAIDLVWRNTIGDRRWNSTSANWLGTDTNFFTGDRVTFEDFAAATGRVYVGTAPTTPEDVRPGALTVTGGQYEFDGGEIQGGPAAIQGGARVIDRRLTRSLFGSGALTLSGDGEFWRQATNDTIDRLQSFSNAFVVAGVGTVQGGRGTNVWAGGIDLKSRLSVGFTNPVVANINRFLGTLTVNRDTNSAAARVVALRAGGGQAYLDGPIVDDPDTNHTGAFLLWLETGADSGVLTLTSTGNTYACGTVVTNAGGTNGVVVAVGSSLGTGPVTLAGAGARLTVYAAGAIVRPLAISSNTVVTLAADGAVAGATNTVTVASGGRLALQSGDCLPNTGGLILGAAGQVQIGTNLVETVGDLYVGGVRKSGGTYTRVELPANISGDGALRVLGEAATGLMLLVR